MLKRTTNYYQIVLLKKLLFHIFIDCQISVNCCSSIIYIFAWVLDNGLKTLYKFLDNYKKKKHCYIELWDLTEMQATMI